MSNLHGSGAGSAFRTVVVRPSLYIHKNRHGKPNVDSACLSHIAGRVVTRYLGGIRRATIWAPLNFAVFLKYADELFDAFCGGLV